METKKLEVMVGKKAEKDAAKEKVGKTYAKPQKQDEVGGRAWVERWVQCPWCASVGWINYDTEHYHTYTCHACTLPMTF